MLTGLAAIVLLFAVAVPAFGVEIYARTLPAAIVTLLLGAACLASLGVAVASLVKTADQAMPVAQLTFLPISFISGIWFPLDGAPDWLLKVSHFFPLSHIVNAFGGVLRARVERQRFHGGDLLAIAIWTAVGLFVAVRRFRWEPYLRPHGGSRARSSTRSIRAASRTPTATGSVICAGSSAGSTISPSSAWTSSGCRRSTPRRRTTRLRHQRLPGHRAGVRDAGATSTSCSRACTRAA